MTEREVRQILAEIHAVKMVVLEIRDAIWAMPGNSGYSEETRKSGGEPENIDTRHSLSQKRSPEYWARRYSYEPKDFGDLQPIGSRHLPPGTRESWEAYQRPARPDDPAWTDAKEKLRQQADDQVKAVREAMEPRRPAFEQYTVTTSGSEWRCLRCGWTIRTLERDPPPWKQTSDDIAIRAHRVECDVPPASLDEPPDQFGPWAA